MKKTTRGRKRKIRLELCGDIQRDDLLIGSHGNTDIKIKGNFQLSGTIYNPRHTVTFTINGDGRISLRGKCNRIIIKKMRGNCTLDLDGVTYKELQCESVVGNSVVIAGNARAITPAILSDDATLHIQAGQLLFNPVTSGNARILSTSSTGEVEEVFTND